MNKPFLKGIGVLIIAAIAVAVCFLGYKFNNERQYQQRVAYAETAVTNEKVKLEQLQKTIAALYTNDKNIFIKKEATTAKVTKIRSELEAIRTSATDFGIREDSLPAGAQELDKEKADLVAKLTEAADKLRIQDQTNRLFTEKIKDWQKYQDDLIIRDNLKEKEVTEIRGKLSSFSDDAWRKVAANYLKDAAEQAKIANELQATLDKLLKKGAVVTYDDYLNVLNEIEKIRNQKLKDKFYKLSDEVAIAVGSVTEEVPEATTAESTSIEETPAATHEAPAAVITPTPESSTEPAASYTPPATSEVTETPVQSETPVQEEIPSQEVPEQEVPAESTAIEETPASSEPSTDVPAASTDAAVIDSATGQ